MEPRKLTKEDIDKVRHIEGFPIGTDEDIIALSNAPFYTACPNPFIEEFINEYGTPYDEETDDYHREPFAADVSEGKYDPIYKLHPYHTKVPHRAIMRYILHYTNPGDIVYDGFCGTGMTGVAAQACGLSNDQNVLAILRESRQYTIGKRRYILSDLSPVATFLAKNFNSSIDVNTFADEENKLLSEIEKHCSWMYKTNHVDNAGHAVHNMDGLITQGIINYTVWSDVFICPNCGSEIVFWDSAVNKEAGKVKEVFACSKCLSNLKKKDCEHAVISKFDNILNKAITQYKQIPVLINYSIGKKRFEKRPDTYDIELMEKIENESPVSSIPISRMITGSEGRRNDPSGTTHVHQFYTKRNLLTLAYFKTLISKDSPMMFALTKVANQLTKMYRFTYMNGCWGAGGGPMSGTLYIPSLIKELNMVLFLQDAIKLQGNRTNFQLHEGCISTQSTTNMCQLKDNSIDYIFTDPPFGDNLSYSELNHIWESWIGVNTNYQVEAVVNKSHGKLLSEYQQIIADCFATYYRVLKPNRWITVEFHNSKNAVWNAIQESLQKSGFIIADVRTLDKKHSSFKQVTASGAVKQDLVISAYKPKESFLRSFIEKAGTEETAWSFVRQHLENIPVAVVKHDKIEVIAERQAYLLFDRMVAYHIMNGMPVPLDATDFYRGLDEKFLKRDNMYFLADQVNEYDTARIKSDVEPIQFELFVTNERSAIAWLYQQLESGQTYAELQPKFMQEVKSVDKFEVMPELSVLLDENFLQNDDGKWYIPDITKEGDVAKLREKKLWKEFEGYLSTKGKLKLFRSEAIRVGFARLWKDKNYQAIVTLAERLPEATIQEDPNLLMYYDISSSRL